MKKLKDKKEIIFNGPGIKEEKNNEFVFIFDENGEMFVHAKTVITVLKDKKTKAGVEDFIKYLHEQRIQREPNHMPGKLGEDMMGIRDLYNEYKKDGII